MTNKELILIKEPVKNRYTKDINHGCFITYIPFNSIENLFFKDYKMMIVLRMNKIITINFSPGNPDFEVFKAECEEFTSKNKVFKDETSCFWLQTKPTI